VCPYECMPRLAGQCLASQTVGGQRLASRKCHAEPHMGRALCQASCHKARWTADGCQASSHSQCRGTTQRVHVRLPPSPWWREVPRLYLDGQAVLPLCMSLCMSIEGAVIARKPHTRKRVHTRITYTCTRSMLIRPESVCAHARANDHHPARGQEAAARPEYLPCQEVARWPVPRMSADVPV